MQKKHILVVFGTRPEVIKMAPIIHEIQNNPLLKLSIISCGQHREMLDQMLQVFQITPDIELNLMRPQQSLAEITASLPVPLDKALEETDPDMVLGQGDTTTALMAALAAFYRQIPFGHVEAGLRTGNFSHPYPEEMNRKLIGQLATIHFAPTEQNRENLLSEGINPSSIHVVGNTVIDALQTILKRKPSLPQDVDPQKRLLLVTGHRRENLPLMGEICRAIHHLVEKNSDLQVLFPVHLNPKVQSIVYETLGNHPQILLHEPLPYESFVAAMRHAYLIISDSGGVQEEAPFLNTPVLVTRETTEREEAITAGASRMVGSNRETIIQEAQTLIDDKNAYNAMCLKGSPFGDGQAAKRIVASIQNV